MNLETIDAKLRERLDPHVNALLNGSSTEYDILPAVFSVILNKQSSLIDSQNNIANSINYQSGELKSSHESDQETLIKIISLINNQNDIFDVKLGDFKLQQDTDFKEILNSLTGINELISGLLKKQDSLESALLLAQNERLSIRKISISNLIFSITSIALLASILFIIK